MGAGRSKAGPRDCTSSTIASNDLHVVTDLNCKLFYVEIDPLQLRSGEMIFSVELKHSDTRKVRVDPGEMHCKYRQDVQGALRVQPARVSALGNTMQTLYNTVTQCCSLLAAVYEFYPTIEVRAFQPLKSSNNHNRCLNLYISNMMLHTYSICRASDPIAIVYSIVKYIRPLQRAISTPVVVALNLRY